ncbi:MAG: haloacid dehalogenase-like hydrolase family protein [Massilia sp.]|nr:haloacid dehalogenase-like hydrolase family protein [Massilia sp.]
MANMTCTSKRLMILDADGTTIDAYSAIETTFLQHGMTLGDEDRFQKRHRLFKYLGGLREFPTNLKKQLGKQSRKELIATLTEVYRSEARLYPGIAALINRLIDTPDLVVGIVTRNITNAPEDSLRVLFERHGVDVERLGFLTHIPLRQEKTATFRALREQHAVNPARSYICGDEHKDYFAAVRTGMHPFMVSYGFEDHQRLTVKFEVPDEVISRTPDALCRRVVNGLGLAVPE